MLFFIFEIFINLGKASQCPEKPSDYLDLPSKPESGKKYYKCDKLFGYDGQFGLTNSLLSIYYCSFKNIVAIFNKESLGIIKIKIDDSMSNTLIGNINIEYCSFESCHGAILIDSTDSSREFNFYNCTFYRCLSMIGAAIIDFKSVNGKIEKCYFHDCITTDSTSGYISFNPPNIENNDKIFTITNNVFDHSASNSYSFLSIVNDNGKLEFSKNKVIISDLTIEIYVVSYPNSANVNNWKFSENCISPFRPDAITKTNNAKIVDSFKECVSEGPICPPVFIPNAKKYENHCYENLNDQVTDIIAENTAIALFYCTFTSVKADETNKGGAIQITLNYKFDDVYLPFFIYNCTFDRCSAFEGGALYIETINSYVFRLFEIRDCKFTSNKCYKGLEDDVYGGAICIIAGSASFVISGSEFESNEAGYGAAIYYSTATTSSSSSFKVLSSDEYALSVTNCKFTKNKAAANGAAICTIIKNKKLYDANEIEITNCEFLENRAEENEWNDIAEELPENGGAIYFEFDVQSNQNNNLAFGINDCTFSRNVASSKGAAVCISILKTEPSKPIKINRCSFKQNQAYPHTEILCYGSDICYTHNSQSSSFSSYGKVVLESLPSLQVNDCNFSDSLSKYRGGSIYIEILNEQASRMVEFNKCSFKDINTQLGGAVEIHMTNPSVLFHLFDCEFQGESSIYFNGITGHVEKCKFNNIKGVTPIHYECNSSESTSEYQSFTIENCIFNQNNNIYSLVFFVPKVSSRFVFNNNEINIPNSKTFVFNCDADNELKGSWKFNGNSINPDNESLIKSENATSIHFGASCFRGFSCTTQQPPGFNCEKNKHCYVNGNEQPSLSFIDVSNSNFNGLKEVEGKGGAAIHLNNYGIVCNKAEFKECTSEKGGGGAIYIHLDKIIESLISITSVTFTKCSAVFGGAVYIYSDQEDNQIGIYYCIFVQNKAGKKSYGIPLYGGSAIYITAKKGSIDYCNFINNVGNSIKVDNMFENSIRSAKEIKSFVSFGNCSFEASQNATASIFVLFNSNVNKVGVEVNDCTFKGKLSKDSYHIDGFSHLGKIENIRIKSCIFESGNKNSINTKSFKMSSQKFNFKEFLKNTEISFVASIFGCFTIVLILVIKMGIGNPGVENNNDIVTI